MNKEKAFVVTKNCGFGDFFSLMRFSIQGSRLRIVTVNGLESDSAHVKAAHAELAHLCTNVQAAWDRIYADAHFLIEIKSGHRSSVSVLRLLSSAGITLRSDVPESPLVILHKLSSWAISANATFDIFGIKKPPD